MGAGAEEKAWELGVEMQFRREKLRRRIEALGEWVQSLDGVLRLHGGGGQTPGVERGSLFDAYVVAVRLIGGVC